MTGTTQPDPAREWAAAWLEDHPDARPADVHRAVGVVYGKDEADRVVAVFRKPLMVADIPAGQGPPSLYVDAESTAVMYRTAEGRSVPVPAMWVPTDSDGIDALNAALSALAATLPTVTAEEGP